MLKNIFHLISELPLFLTLKLDMHYGVIGLRNKVARMNLFRRWTHFYITPDLKQIFQETDEIRLYFYIHSHGAEKRIQGNHLLYVVRNNGTVCWSCRNKNIARYIFNSVSEISRSLLFPCILLSTSCIYFSHFLPVFSPCIYFGNFAHTIIMIMLKYPVQ
jgi:hypothetical protein